MTVSKKQLEANKKNAQKGGVKTPKGKAIVKYNALKHGLLAKETVITVGEGAENPEEFSALLYALQTQLVPAGTLGQTLIEICDERIVHHKEQIVSLEKQKVKNKLKLQVIKKLGNIPSRDELDRLLRYEGAIERQLYKALNQLERIQRLRLGDNVPAPVEVDVDVNTGQNA